ncbi:hypothetical protein GN956_G14631 [Arapaima gigas]
MWFTRKQRCRRKISCFHPSALHTEGMRSYTAPYFLTPQTVPRSLSSTSQKNTTVHPDPAGFLTRLFGQSCDVLLFFCPFLPR